MRAEISLILIVVAIFSAAPCLGDEIASEKTEISEKDTDMPSMELLEFLGSWETDDGEWVDPMLLENTPLPEEESADE